MILVYTHTNPALVGLAKSMLESEGIGCMLKNEFSTAGIPPYNLDQELWVLNDQDVDKATGILAGLEEAPDPDSGNNAH